MVATPGQLIVPPPPPLVLVPPIQGTKDNVQECLGWLDVEVLIGWLGPGWLPQCGYHIAFHCYKVEGA